MTKNELIAHISEETCVAKTAVMLVLDNLAEITAGQLAIAREFSLPGIGKLQAANRAARAGRNPRTGETVQIEASVAVKFKPSKSLKDAVN